MFVSETSARRNGGDLLRDLPIKQLEQQLERHAANANAQMCSWLELVAEFDRRRAYADWGCTTCSQWISWRCSVSLRSAREHVRVAGRLNELPLIHSEFAAGRVSYSKVRALTRIATPESEEELVQLAGETTAAQLDRLVRAYSRASAAAAGETYRNRFVTWLWETDGSLSIHANLPAEDGALVVKAIEAACEELRELRAAEAAERAEAAACESNSESGSAEPLRREEDGYSESFMGSVSRAEGLVAVATDALAARRNGIESKPADRNMVVVHVDADELCVDGDGRCHIRDGSGLPAETARRLACDASVVTLLERGGEPLSVGRKTRSVPPAIRRAVEARDQGCRFPGCHNTRYVDAHHIRHWASGGETSAKNLLMLCRRHHRLVHEGGYEIQAPEGAVGNVVFKRPDGMVLEPSPAPPPVDLEGGPGDPLLRPARCAPDPASAWTWTTRCWRCSPSAIPARPRRHPRSGGAGCSGSGPR